jgi:hypothetical protein
MHYHTERYRGYLIREHVDGYTVAAPDGYLVCGHDDKALTLAGAREAAAVDIDGQIEAEENRS